MKATKSCANFISLIYIPAKDGDLTDDIYIGISDYYTEGRWKTVESRYKCDAQFIDWRPGQPNNAGDNEHCAAIRKSWNGKWLDIRCNKLHHFLCQGFQ